MNLNELTPEQLNALNNRMQREVNENIDPSIQKTTFGDTLDTDKLAYTDPLIIQHNREEYGDDVMSSGGQNLTLEAKIKQLEKELPNGPTQSILSPVFFVDNISVPSPITL